MAVPRVRCHEGPAGPPCKTQEPLGWRYYGQPDYALRELSRRVSRKAALIAVIASNEKEVRTCMMSSAQCLRHPTASQKLITLVTVTVLSGILSVAACFALLLVGKFSKISIFSWRACFIAVLVVFSTFLGTFWVMVAGEVRISFALYLLLVWLVELGAIVSGAFAFSGPVRYLVVILLALCLVLVNRLFPVLRFSPPLVFNISIF
jgi:hypothetical protein